MREGYSPAETGLGLAGYGAGGLAAAVVGGLLADRVGCGIRSVLSMAGSACAMLALAWLFVGDAVSSLVPAALFGAALYGPSPEALSALCFLLGAVASLLVLRSGRARSDARGTLG